MHALKHITPIQSDPAISPTPHDQPTHTPLTQTYTTQIVMPRISFVGHLSGLLVGILQAYGFFGFLCK